MDIVKETADLLKEREKWESAIELSSMLPKVKEYWYRIFWDLFKVKCVEVGLSGQNGHFEFICRSIVPVGFSLELIPLQTKNKDGSYPWSIWIKDNEIRLWVSQDFYINSLLVSLKKYVDVLVRSEINNRNQWIASDTFEEGGYSIVKADWCHALYSTNFSDNLLVWMLGNENPHEKIGVLCDFLLASFPADKVQELSKL